MSKYEVVEKLWSHAKFNVHIAQIPTEKINDKLAVLSDGSGTITFDRYDRFLLNTCLVDSGKVWSFIDSLEGDPETFVDAAVELRNIILEVNPLLDPSLLIINSENIIKLPEKDHTPDNSRLLIGNVDWEKPEFEGPMGLEDIEDFIKNLPPPVFPVDPGMAGIDASNLIAEMCTLLELLVTVIKYDAKDIPDIFKSKYTFEDAEPYRLFIVSKCILDFKSLFLIIDRMGMSRKHSPEKIAEELYKLSIKHNPFLSWENIDLIKVKKAVIDKFGKSTRPKSDFSKSGAPPVPKQGKNAKGKSFTDRPGAEEEVEFYRNFDEMSEEDVMGLPKKVKDWVIGQDEAVDVVCETIQLAKCGLKEPGTPIGTFMLTGETGCGKTYSSKMFAKELCGDEHAIVRIDCSEYAQKHEVSKLIGCFPPETTVTMKGGLVKPIKEVEIGEEVISHTGKVREIRDKYEYEYSGKLCKINIVNDNRPVKCTPNHEFLVVKSERCWHKGREHVACKPTCSRNKLDYPCTNRLYEKYEPEWIMANNLKEGDFVLQSRYKDDLGYPDTLDLSNFCPDGKVDSEYIWFQENHKVKRFITVDKDFVRLAGYYVAEGGADRKRIDFSFHYDEVEYQKEVESLVYKLFGKEVRFTRCPSEELSGHKRKRVYVGSKPIAGVFKELFGSGGAENKKLPEWWLNLPDHLLKEFVTTAIFGDGCTTVSRRVDYCSVSLNLTTQLRNILAKLGYMTYLSKRKPGEKSVQYSYKLYVGGQQLRELKKDMPGLDLKFDEIRNGVKGVVENSNIQRMSYIDDKYIYRQIRKIDLEPYNGKVYDLSVDQDVSYQVLDIIAHNSPQGYVGFEEGGYLTNAMAKTPFTVVLFDEIEKAHPKVHNILLQIMDEGRLTSNKGETVTFNDALIILTSNIGVKEVRGVSSRVGMGSSSVLTKDKQKKAIKEALKNSFKPEFLNRLDGIVTFNRLNKEACLRIVDLAFEKLNGWLKERKITVKYNEAVKNYIYSVGFKEGFGARPLNRAMKRYVMLPISKVMLNDKVKGDVIVTVTVKKNELNFTTKSNKKAPAKKGKK